MLSSLLNCVTTYTRAQKVALFMHLLIFFGGVGTGGVGMWVGKTFVLEPLPAPPEVTSVEVLVPTPLGHNYGIALVDVTMDRLGRCDLWVGGVRYAVSGVANEYRFVVHSPDFAGWYALPEENRPAWLQNIVTEPRMLGTVDD